LGSTGRLAEVINRKRLDRIIVVNGCLSDREADECGVISKRMAWFSIALSPFRKRPLICVSRNVLACRCWRSAPRHFHAARNSLSAASMWPPPLFVLPSCRRFFFSAALLIKATCEGSGVLSLASRRARRTLLHIRQVPIHVHGEDRTARA